MSLDAFQKQELNVRMIQLMMLILAHDKLVDKLLIPIADSIIDKAAKLTTGIEVTQKQPKVKAIEGVGELLGRSTAAKKILEDIKEQSEELEQLRMSMYETFTSHFASQPDATNYVEEQEKKVIHKVREYGLELLDRLHKEVDRKAVKELESKHEVVLSYETSLMTNKEFANTVVKWSGMNS